MALLTFPVPTHNGQLYPVNPLPGENQYRWSAAAQTWILLGPATGVDPNTYGDGNNVGQFTVDAQGKITFAENVPIASGAGGTVTSVATGTGLTGGPITGAGTIALLPATSSVIGGVYPDGSTITVDGSGQISVINGGGATLQQVTSNGATTADVITVGGLVSNGALLPGAHETYDLGSAAAAWNTLYVKNTSIYLGPYKLSVVGGVLDIDGSSVSSGGTVTSVTAGDGLDGGTIVTNGTISLKPATTSTLGGVIADGTSILISPTGIISAVGDGTGTVTAVTAGTGLSGGTITTSGTIDLANTAVSAGSYTYGSFTVDQQGRLTAASSGAAPMPLTGGTFSGLVTFNVTPTFSPGVDIGPAAQVTYASTSGLTAVNVQDALDELATTACQGTVTSVAAGTGLSGGTITSSGTIALANTTVAAGSYTNANITVDAQGRLTAASSGSGSSGTVTSVATGTGLTGGTITTSGTVSLADTAVSPGTYNYSTLTVDQQGRLTSASSGTPPVTCLDFDAKGDLLAGSGSDSFGTVAIGTDGQVLMADAACASGMKWDTITQCQGTVTCIETSFGLCPATITTSGSIRIANASAMGLGGVYGCTTNSNTALGLSSLSGNPGGDNVALGYSAMGNATIGGNSIAIGSSALLNGGGDCNIAIGFLTLVSAQSTARANMAIGHGAGLNMSSAVGNIGIGYQALLCTTTGWNNVEIGANNFSTALYDPPFVITTQDNRVVLGNRATSNAYIKVAWTVTSDERDKAEIQPLALGLDFVSQLEPVSFKFKESRDSEVATGPVRYGFTAQNVLAAEGDSPVIVDTEDLDNLKMTDSHLIPVLVQAIKELKAEVEDLRSQLG